MKRSLVQMAAMAALAMMPAGVTGAAPNPLVGAWAVDRFVDMPEGEKPVYPFGEKPVGLFIFTADGHFSFNVMGAPGGGDASGGRVGWTPASYVSYFGTYRYDPAGSSWTAQVMGGNVPGYTGTSQTRGFKLVGKVLTISATAQENGRTIRVERVLHKIDR
ncbi:MAG: lipocalin-like domain-containing protein [Candidatus Sphingomonas phytovorans]|nr:lipocalin-like domain-containing protein [Sphingomonas sp.]WEK01643.1 MAG: lipocalin-like domain-containing protein [Sphingomonas sp.]